MFLMGSYTPSLVLQLVHSLPADTHANSGQQAAPALPASQMQPVLGVQLLIFDVIRSTAFTYKQECAAGLQVCKISCES